MARLTVRSLVVFGTLANLLALASPAQAQQCGGSQLLYIVRDAKGTAVDAASASFAFQDGAATSLWSRSWSTNRGGVYEGFASLVPAALLEEVKGRVAPLSVGSMGSSGCVFTTAVTLKVTMGDKTMNLVFNVASRCCGSKRILIDGLAFQEGKFEVTPSISEGSPQVHFVPARGWTKISN